jgi:TRAP-type C4-dicarboxylate transport system permease small subunit
MKNSRIFVDRLVESFLVAILGIMVVNVLWQVFTRFFTNSPSSFTDELARYLMIWLGILGAAYVTGKNEHVTINFFAKKFSEKLQKLISSFISISVLGFAFFGMLIGGCRLVYITTNLEQYSPSLKIPLAVVYAILPVSGLLIIFYKLTQSKK